MRYYEFIHRPELAEGEKPASIFEKIPAYPCDRAGKNKRHTGNAAEQHLYFAASGADLLAYREVLLKEGYKVWQENEINGNIFCTLCNDEFKIHLQYFKHLSQVRINAEPLTTLPVRPQDNQYTDKGIRPSITQLWLDYSDVDCGMSYEIQLCDGSFVIIDGGWSKHNEAETLFNFIKSKTPAGEKPVIAGWILTHHHPDHIFCFYDFMKRFGSEVTLEAVIYNNPGYNAAARVGEHLVNDYTRLETFMEELGEEVLLYKPHAGERYYIRDSIWECMMTHEELTFEPLNNTNNTSIIFKMTLAEKTTMWLADCAGIASRFMMPAYEYALKSDIVQVGHHGYGDIMRAIYHYIDPKIALWPVPEYRHDVIPSLTEFFNKYTHLEEIYFEYDEDHTIEL